MPELGYSPGRALVFSAAFTRKGQRGGEQGQPCWIGARMGPRSRTVASAPPDECRFARKAGRAHVVSPNWVASAEAPCCRRARAAVVQLLFAGCGRGGQRERAALGVPAHGPPIAGVD